MVAGVFVCWGGVVATMSSLVNGENEQART